MEERENEKMWEEREEYEGVLKCEVESTSYRRDIP
jgi:hypothetical protein